MATTPTAKEIREMRRNVSFYGINCRRMKPTKNHRPAIWECIFGTVYAQNEDGVIEYFDYNRDAAIAFAGVSADRDPRVAKNDEILGDHSAPKIGQKVLYIKKEKAIK